MEPVETHDSARLTRIIKTTGSSSKNEHRRDKSTRVV
jgi:hypothetical protein